jgi:hypothetical protein
MALPKRSALLVLALGSDKTDPIMGPVDVAEAQLAHFARAEAIN